MSRVKIERCAIQALPPPTTSLHKCGEVTQIERTGSSNAYEPVT